MKITGSVLEEKIFFKMLGLSSCSKLDWVSYIAPLLNLPPRKLEP